MYNPVTYINKYPDNRLTTILDEPVVVSSLPVYLLHDNIRGTITAKTIDGTAVTDFAVTYDFDSPWRYLVTWGNEALTTYEGQTLYVTYGILGDQWDAQKLNDLIAEVVRLGEIITLGPNVVRISLANMVINALSSTIAGVVNSAISDMTVDSINPVISVTATNNPTSTINVTNPTDTNITVNGVVTNLDTGFGIDSIRVAYALNGTDVDGNAAVSSGRYFDITQVSDINNFQGAGYTKTGLNLNGVYTPYVRVTQYLLTDPSTKVTGVWTTGSQFTAVKPASILVATLTTDGINPGIIAPINVPLAIMTTDSINPAASVPSYTMFEDFEGGLNGTQLVNGISTVDYSNISPISGSKSLLIDKTATNEQAAYYLLNFPQTPANVELTFKLRVERLGASGQGVANFGGTGKEWNCPVLAVLYYRSGSADWAGAFTFGVSTDGYLMATMTKADGTSFYLVTGTPLTLNQVYTITVRYHRIAGGSTASILVDGSYLLNNVSLGIGSEAIQGWSKLGLGSSHTSYYSGKFTVDDFQYKDLG